MSELTTTSAPMAERITAILTRTYARDAALFLLRGWLGAMTIVHGIPKIFGGMERFTGSVEKLGFPAAGAFAWLAALSEFGGGIALLVGLMSRPAAVLVAGTMAVAAFLRHADDPFKSKELALTYLVAAVVLMLLGPGRYALDSLLKRGGRTGWRIEDRR